MFDLAVSERKGEGMSVYEASMLMLVFATLVIRIIGNKDDIRKNNHLLNFDS